MDIDEIISIWERCRNGEFEKIPNDFYSKIHEMIKDREKKKENANEDEYYRLEDDIRVLKRIRRDVFEKRTWNILKMAWRKVCGDTIDEENMTDSEKEFYSKIVEILERFKRTVFGERKEEKVLVRVRRDIPEFEGIDGRIYRLRKEDVILLPKLNAKALIDGGLAEEIDLKR